MKKLIAFVLSLTFVLALVGCGFIVREQQLMYNSKIYVYDETEFADILPEGYELVGVVKETSDSKLPKEDYHGCRVVVGQNVYGSNSNSLDIYLEFDNGYAKFILLQ